MSRRRVQGEQASLLRQYIDEYRAGRLPGKPEGDAKAEKAKKGRVEKR